MTTETGILIAGAVVLAALLLKQGARIFQRRDLTPVSRQWLMDQRVRDEH